MTLGLTRPRLLLLVLGIAGEFLMYSQAGAKAVLFNILLVPLLYLAIRFLSGRFGVVLMWASVGLLAITVAVTAVTGSLWPIALYAVRLIALPGELTAYYLDFFTSHTTYELSQSFLRWFTQQPYAVEPPQLIGALYLHTTVNANANMWGRPRQLRPRWRRSIHPCPRRHPVGPRLRGGGPRPAGDRTHLGDCRSQPCQWRPVHVHPDVRHRLHHRAGRLDAEERKPSAGWVWVGSCS